MKIKRVCRSCQAPLSAIARIDAAYCSTKCRVYSHRNPFPKEMIELFTLPGQIQRILGLGPISRRSPKKNVISSYNERLNTLFLLLIIP